VLDLPVRILIVSPTWHGPVPANSRLRMSGELVQSPSFLVFSVVRRS
jgi:hypothetical protein